MLTEAMGAMWKVVACSAGAVGKRCGIEPQTQRYAWRALYGIGVSRRADVGDRGWARITQQAMLILLDQPIQQVRIVPPKSASDGRILGLHPVHEIAGRGVHAIWVYG